MKHAGRLQSGVAAVELALLLFPLVMLTVGVAEYGRAMYQYNALAKAVRTGARYLSQYHPSDQTAITAAKNLVTCGKTLCTQSDTALVPGLTTSLVHVTSTRETVTANNVTVGATNLVRVSVEGFEFTSVGSALVKNFKFEPISVTMKQALT